MSKVDYKAIFENTAASILIERDDVILLVNRKFEDIFGCQRDEIEGKKKWTEFVAEDDLPNVKECLWRNEASPDIIKDTCEFRFIDLSENIKYYFAAIREIPSTNTAVISLLDITDRKLAEEALRQRDLELEEANVAIKVLLNHKQEETDSLEENILNNVNSLIVNSIENLKRLALSDEQKIHLQMLEKQLHEITSPLLQNRSISMRDLTLRQTQIASLIKEGRTSKEIAERLHITPSAVGFHRGNLRSKLGMTKDGKSLRSYLMSS